MNKKVCNIKAINSKDIRDIEVQYPSLCPMCNRAGDPTCIGGHYIKDSSMVPNMFLVFFCHSCERVFIGNYAGGNGYGIASLCSLEPQNNIKEKIFSDNIKEMSPSFCQIYNQAYASQQHGLNDICGIGYRKSLEFLVKDYAIYLNPDNAEEIKKELLSKCINDYIDSKRIKQLALASAWLGNDETHYNKKHQEYDVDDLIVFIDAMVSFIDSDLSAIKAEELINSKKSSNKN